MENLDLLVDLALAMMAALLGGFIANRLGQPVILGYLLAGVLIGPYTAGPVAHIETVQTLANLGVTLLMFALGTEFSLEALNRVRNVAVYGGIIQIALCILLGTILGVTIGYALTDSIFLGGIIAISSSILMLKLLLARDEVESITGRVALGTGIVQDIAMVPLIIILPALSEGFGLDSLANAGLAVLKGGGFLVVAYIAGTRIVPPLLAWIARNAPRELFLLAIVAIAVGTAMLGQFVGISFALGAFLAGLIVAESELSTQVVEEIVPVRDIFATLFFVSIGMLINPAYLFSHGGELALLVATILIGKFAISAGIVRLFGYQGSVAARTGLLLAQIGEFSFVLASVGLAQGAINESLYNLVLAGALVTLIMNPLLVNNAGRLWGLVGGIFSRFAHILPTSIGTLGRREPAQITKQSDADLIADLKRHVIICGYGRVGQEIARALNRRGFRFVVIDYTPSRVERGRKDGCLVIQGDATNPSVLERAGMASAKMLAVTLPDLPSAEQIVRAAHARNPRAHILARASDARGIPYLTAAGADEVVQPEFEAGLEMVRQALRSYGVSSLETQSLTGGRRQEHYRGGRSAGVDLAEER